MAITNHRQPDDLVDAFGTAETLLRERQVSGNAQHHGVVEARGALIELAYRHRAGRRVDRRKDIADLALAGVGRRRDILEIGADQLEARRLIADRRQITIGAEREIGRASCRESVCQDVLISEVAVSLKKNNRTNTR